VSDLPRSAWNGVLQLRELVVPIGFVSAQTKAQDFSFRLIHDVCGEPVEQTRGCPVHGKVPEEELVKGWEIAPGTFVRVEPDELAAIAPPDNKVVDVYAIVDAGDVDPMLATRAYYLLPKRSKVSRDGYAALEQALRLEQLVGLARFTAFGTEHLAALVPHRYVLALQELAPAHDLRDPGPIADLVAAVELDERTCALARKLVSRLEVPYEPALLTSRHRERLQRLYDARLADGTSALTRPAVDELMPAPTVDLAGALTDSLRGIPKSRKARVDAALART
jgi:DNA end-binding protein Ku